jgi:hypothetical protein
MTPSALFSFFNLVALAGWLLLAAGVFLKRPWLRDTVSGIYMPVFLSAAYAALIILFFARADGGFDTLDNVQKLFAAPWIALAGWIHYLAFDLFIGAKIARGVEEQGLPRWLLVPLLPLTFLFGPAGLLCFEILKAVSTRLKAAS